MNFLQVQNPKSREFAQSVDSVFKLDGSEQIGSESFHPNKLTGSSEHNNLDKIIKISGDISDITNSSYLYRSDTNNGITGSRIGSVSGNSSSGSFVSGSSVSGNSASGRLSDIKAKFSQENTFFRKLNDQLSINFALFTFFVVFVILYVIPPVSFIVDPKTNQRNLYKVILTSFICSIVVYLLSLVKIF